VERFAETLDKMTSQARRGSKTRQNATLEMVRQHNQTAQSFVNQLQEHRKLEVESRTRQHWVRILHGIDEDESHQAQSLQLLSQDAPEGGQDTYMETLEDWEEEARTWELLESLLRVQHPDVDPKYSRQGEERLQNLEETPLYSTNQELWERFLLEDKTAQEYDIVLSWLKDIAEISGNDIELLLDAIKDHANTSSYARGSGWLHTKLAIKNQKRLRSWPKPLNPSSPGISESLRTSDGTESLVTQLDPDAPTRQQKTLDNIDATSESVTWLLCWELIRRGENPERIRDICLEQGEGWRGVLLGNGQPFRKPKVATGRQSSNHSELSSSNMTSHSVWRQTCRAAAQNMDAGGDAHEKAIYGAMAGDRRSVEQVCKSWNDLLFAHYNALLMARFEAFAVSQKKPGHQDSTMLRDKLAAMSFTPANQSESPLAIIDSLRPYLDTYKEPLRLMKSLQGALISRNFIALARAYGTKARQTLSRHQSSNNNVLQDHGSAFSAQDIRGLRMMTHVLFVFQDLGLDISVEGLQDIQYIIIGYMEYLRDSRRMDMLPIYASRLPREEGAFALGRLLIDVDSAQERDHQIRLMAKVGIDSSRVVYHLMHDIIDRVVPSEDESPSIDSIDIVTVSTKTEESSATKNGPRLKANIIGEPTVEDMVLVQAYEWYLAIKTDVLDDWTEALAIGCQLYSHFFRKSPLSFHRIKLTSSKVSGNSLRPWNYSTESLVKQSGTPNQSQF
jgi:nuclear pore complex protein Nup107